MIGEVHEINIEPYYMLLQAHLVQCPGRILGITGLISSVSKSNMLKHPPLGLTN